MVLLFLEVVLVDVPRRNALHSGLEVPEALFVLEEPASEVPLSG